MIPRRKCPRDIVRSDQTKAKAVSFAFVLGSIVLKIFPQFAAEGILWVDACQITLRKRPLCDFGSIFRMQDVTQRRNTLWWQNQVLPGEGGFFAKANDNDPLSVLR